MITAHESYYQNLKDNIRWGNRDIQQTLADPRWEISTMFVISLAVNTLLAALVVWAVAK